MFKFSPPPASTPFCTHAHKPINVVSYHALKSFPSKKIRRGVQRWAPDQTCPPPPRLGGSGGGSAGPEWWGSSRRLGAWTTQPRRNGATLASCWQRLSYVYKMVPDLDPLVSYRLLTTSCRKFSKIELTSLKQSIVINTDEMFYIFIRLVLVLLQFWGKGPHFRICLAQQFFRRVFARQQRARRSITKTV